MFMRAGSNYILLDISEMLSYITELLCKPVEFCFPAFLFMCLALGTPSTLEAFDHLTARSMFKMVTNAGYDCELHTSSLDARVTLFVLQFELEHILF